MHSFVNPTPEAGDEFGFAIAAVGSNVVVGAPFDDTAGLDAGAVYLFDGASGALVRTFLDPAPGVNDHFGWSVAAVGSNILIGAPLDPSGSGGGGAAYLYNGSTGGLIQVFLNPAPAANDEFGATVAAFGADVLIGAPRHDIPASGFIPAAPDAGAVYLFNGGTGALIRTFLHPSPEENDQFGWSVTAIGNDVAIGSPGDDLGATDAGAVYLFDGATGALVRVLKKPTPANQDQFGTAVAAVGTGKILVGVLLDDTGAPNAGAAYLFSAGTGGLLQGFHKGAPAANDEFGRAVVSLGGGKVLIGAPSDDTSQLDAGAVYVFQDDSCGNGVLDPGEQCEDGNLVNGDGCDSNCTPTGCGNGVVTAGEQCDDGNLTAGDGCSATCTTEGVCGDGVVGPGEQCDDGNLADGDGCDSNCTPTACGNGVVTAGEQCDDGTANGVDVCCSATCQRVDSDADGTCDRDDVCPTVSDPAQLNSDGDVFGDACDVCPDDTDNDSDHDGFCVGHAFNPPAVGGDDPCSRNPVAAAWIKPSALLGKLDLPPGDEKMRIKGDFTLGSMTPLLQPQVNGIHLRIVDKNDTIIVDEHVAGGAFQNGVGWKTIGRPPRKWHFIDKTKPFGIHNGIRKVIIKDLSRFAPNRVGLLIKGKPGHYPLIPGNEPLTVTVELNDTAVPPGSTLGKDQCGEVAYVLAPSSLPSCEHTATAVKCK